MRMKAWQIGVVVTIVLAAGALTAVAIAQSAGGDGRDDDRAAVMGSGNGSGQEQGARNGPNDQGECPDCEDGQDSLGQNGQGSKGQGMMNPDGGMMGPGNGRGLRGAQLSDEQREQVLDLMNQHRADMQDWWQKYGDDQQSDEAQKAMQDLRTEHAEEMQKLFGELGIENVGRGMGRDDAAGSEDGGNSCPGCDQNQNDGAQGNESAPGPSTATPGFSY